MSGVLLAIRIVLAAVLAVAGVAKLADRAGAREAVTGFGVAEPLAGAVAAVLPLIELAAAVLLIPSATARAGSGLALVLMLAFSGAIARSIARGEAPDCHCFGAIHSEPAGPRTLIRNLALAALAAVALAGGAGTSATAWAAALSAGWVTAVVLGVALAGVVTGGGAFALRLLRRHGELLLRIDTLEQAMNAGGVAVPAAEPAPTAGLALGSVAPEFALPDVTGAEVTLASLLAAGDPLLVLFTDPGCGPCSAMLPRVAAWQRERPGGLRPVLVSRGAREANVAHATSHGLVDVLIQTDREVSESFDVSATPSAVVVAPDGTIASAAYAGEEQIASLVEGPAGYGADAGAALAIQRVPAAVRAPSPPPPPAPALRTLDGAPTALREHLHGTTLLVFWNPGCGFCAQMIDRLRELDAARGDGGLLLVSTGSPQANRELGLRATVLLEDGFTTGNALGAGGTPSAVLVDQHGAPVSPVAVGADAVVSLAAGAGAAIAA